MAVLNFGMVNVTFAAHGPENHENEEPVIEENLFDKKYVFSDGCYYRVKGETNEKVWHIVDPETEKLIQNIQNIIIIALLLKHLQD